MGERNAGLANPQHAQGRLFRRDHNFTSQLGEVLGQRTLVPDMHRVPSWRHSGDLDRAASVRNAVVGSIQHYDHGAHFGVDIAEDVTHAWSIKAHVASRSRFVEAQVESLSFKKGEYVVKKRVAIRKIHHSAHPHDQKVGREGLIFLYKRRVLLLTINELEGSRPGRGCQPDHNVSWRVGAVRRRSHFKVASNRNLLPQDGSE